MSAKMPEYYDELFAEAERRRRCVIPGHPSFSRYCTRHVKLGDLVSPQRGMFARKPSWEKLSAIERHLHIARTLAASHPSWTFSHFTAAAAFGLSVPYAKLASVHRLVDPSSRSSSRLETCHVGESGETMRVRGLRITAFERTVFDCLCNLGFEDGVALADSALRLSGMTSMQLCELLDAFATGRSRGIVVARRSACFADGRSESGGESIARAAMHELGFMIPELQEEVPDPLDPSRRYRVDFAWHLPDGRTVLGEFDGREKYADPAMTGGRAAVDVLADERLRESRISRYGYPIMRFGYRDMKDRRFFRRLLDTFGIPRARVRRNGEKILLVPRDRPMFFRGIRARVFLVYPAAA